MLPPLVTCIEPSIGRIDRSMLTDQMLLELLIDGLSMADKEEFMDGNGTYLPVSDLKGIRCDANDNVTNISLDQGLSKVALGHLRWLQRLFRWP